MPKKPERSTMRQRAPGATPDKGPLLKAVQEFDTATLYEAAGQLGAMVPEIRPLARGMRTVGPACTVACPPGDNLMLHAAVAGALPGEVLVAQCHDFTFGVWGEVLMTAARARGIAGLILDGAVRDVEALERSGFPVFCRAVSMRASIKARRGILRMPVTCGGLLVWPGDVVVADETGVVILPVANLEEVVAKARARQEREAKLMEGLRGGKTTLELLALTPLLDDLQQK
jgi:4-hydroxy-4-methyl-2-oxoglutarate aldolase